MMESIKPPTAAGSPPDMTYDFRVCKGCGAAAASAKFALRNATVFVCDACGLHYTNHLDPRTEVDSEVRSGALTPQIRDYIETQLHSNATRLQGQVELLRGCIDLPGRRVLDVGCGGGVFLSLVRRAGAEVKGIEPDDARVEFARSVHHIDVSKFPIEHEHWQSTCRATFDAVTFWDVIEHVNFPLGALEAGANLLVPGGYLLLDTPCRDAFYHRVGAWTYRVSRGRYPSFLNEMYSNVRFGHKQILAKSDVYRLFEAAGLEVLEIRLVHELTFPYSFYLKKLLGADPLVTLARPLVAGFFRIFKIRNKMIVVGRKRR